MGAEPEGRLIKGAFEAHELAQAGINALDRLPEPPVSHMMQWSQLAGLAPPPRAWLIPGWLGWSATLLSGRGGVGKTLLAQHLGTALATQHALLSRSAALPCRVLMWACEDDHDELWRRQDNICRNMGIGFDALTDFHLDSRQGLENELYGMMQGAPEFTSVFQHMKQQVNDLKIDVLILDNIGQAYGGNENDRHQVTRFVNGLIGMVQDRPFCPILLGHPAKGQGSEYSGSTAWENAVRMRWFLSDSLPDQTEPDDVAPGVRYLAKKKSNYTTLDYLRMQIDQGAFQVELPPDETAEQDTPMMRSLLQKRARRVVMDASTKLLSMGLNLSDQPSANFLPTVIGKYRMAEHCTKAELAAAMRDLMVNGVLVRQKVGEYSNGRDRFGLVISPDVPRPETDA